MFLKKEFKNKGVFHFLHSPISSFICLLLVAPTQMGLEIQLNPVVGEG